MRIESKFPSVEQVERTEFCCCMRPNADVEECMIKVFILVISKSVYFKTELSVEKTIYDSISVANFMHIGPQLVQRS
jgi:hypothetical protein